ncbi:MAG: redoxin family protein [Segniliparus sp.]|uniref:redoxin family protein n=1 Tax=Segniliparus sp. TaxID=2804064 RepID=UPI003F3B51E2
MRLIRLFQILVAALALTTGFAAVSAPARADAPEQLQFSATTLDGRDIAGASYAGKPAVFWFWAPWCPFCNQEGPFVGKVAAQHPGVPFVGVASRSDAGAMNDFVNKYGLDFPQIDDSSGEIWGKFGVTWQPAFAFVSSSGNVDMVKFGDLLTEDQLNDRVAALH